MNMEALNQHAGLFFLKKKAVKPPAKKGKTLHNLSDSPRHTSHSNHDTD
jgi:hypothetical protein